MTKAASALFEEVIERLPRARRTPGAAGAARLRFALDRRPRLEQITLIACVLRRDAGRDRLLALERGARIEVHALRAGVQGRSTLAAVRGRAPHVGRQQFVATACAADDFPEAGHVEGLRRQRRLSARRVVLARRRGAIAARFARLVLIAALAVFPIRHLAPMIAATGQIGTAGWPQPSKAHRSTHEKSFPWSAGAPRGAFAVRARHVGLRYRDGRPQPEGNG